MKSAMDFNKVIHFPPKKKLSRAIYWDIHVEYFKNIFAHGGYEVKIKEDLEFANGSFQVEWRATRFLFEYADSDLPQQNSTPTIIFKCHTPPRHPANYKPWFPISFYNWREYETLNALPKTHIPKIIYNCRPYGDAIERRIHVKNILQASTLPIDYNTYDQIAFWKNQKQYAGYIHVGGHHSNMIDRATTSCLFYGGLLICSELPEILPYNKRLIPNEHYILVKDDYSNLIERTEWVLIHPEECKVIRNNGQSFVREWFMPHKLVEWFENNASV